MTSPVERRARDRFDESFGTLDDAVARKAALAHATRYAILSYLHENGDVSREDLATIVENGVESHVGDLIDLASPPVSALLTTSPKRRCTESRPLIAGKSRLT
jgi:DNA-binding transcriptional ArsR family regulator